MKLFFSALIMAIVFTLSSAFISAPSSTEGYKIGDVATDFSLKNIDGRMISLSGFKDAKGYIVIFTCNHCPFSKAYEDRIIALHNNYAAQGYPVIAINPNDPAIQPEDSYANMKLRAIEKAFPFPYVIDDGQKIFPQYGATKTPHVFLLDQKRVVRYMGAIDDNVYEPLDVKEKYLENAINQLQAGKAVTTSHTKAVGCSVKFKK